MKIAGNSRKDGMILYGPHYQVRLVYTEGQADISLTKHGDRAKGVFEKIPVLRGLYSLFCSSKILLLGVGLQLAAELTEKDEKANRLITVADTALSVMLLWRIAGDLKRVRRFHGAEHKVIGAEEDGVPLRYEEVREVSRVSPRCGTNFVGFYLAAQLLMQLLPVRSQSVKTLLAMGVAYEGFRLDRKRYRCLVAPFYFLGGKAQQYITTAEPQEQELRAAIKAMRTLLEAETAAARAEKSVKK